MPDFASKLRNATKVFTFRDFILLPGRSELKPKEIDLSTRITKRIVLSLPMVSSPMDTVTEWRMAVQLAAVGGVGVIHRNMSVEDQVSQVRKVKATVVQVRSADGKGRPLVGAAVSPLDPERCKRLDRVADFLVADVAHFHNSNVMKATSRLSPQLSAELVLGNVGTRQAVYDAVEEIPRVDGFRAGIGSGSVCITSRVTGVGAPTIFAVSEVATAVSELKADIPIIADGGIRGPGDASLSLAAGASSVMLGSLLAGCHESPGRVLTVDGRKVKIHRGMASAAARKVRFALDRYSLPAKGLDEGIEAYVPYAGKARDVLGDMANGLRASFGYAGARSVSDLWRTASFGIVSAASSAGQASRPLATPRGE